MVVPRSWTSIEKQRDLIQSQTYAEPTATDVRFKLGALFLFIGWLTTFSSLLHSIKHYKSSTGNLISWLRLTPPKFLLTLPLALLMISYEAAIAFKFSISPLKFGTNLVFMYGLGWVPIALIILVYEIAGYKDANEDRDLIRQRRIRGAEINAEIGIRSRPHWWTQMNHAQKPDLSFQARIARKSMEIGGDSPTTKNLHNAIEMHEMPNQDQNHGSENNPLRRDAEAVRISAKILFPAGKDASNTRSRKGNELSPATRLPNDSSGERQMSRNSSTSIAASPQKIRSMLDV